MTKQKRLHNDLDTYTSTKVRPTIQPSKNTDFTLCQNAPTESKKKRTKLKSRALSEVLGQKVEKFDLMNSLAQESEDIMFVQIKRGDIDVDREYVLRILSGRSIRSSVYFADKDEVHGLSM